MKFTRRTYQRAIRVVMGARDAAWMSYAETDDYLDYQAYRILSRRVSLLFARASREGYYVG